MAKKQSSPNKLFNRIMTIIAIIFLLVLFFKYGYTPSKDMIVGNSSTQINLSEIQNMIDSNSNLSSSDETKKDTSISLCVVGDIMCHDSQYEDAYNSDSSSYDFSHVFTNIANELQSADLTIGNLETTFAGKDIRI